MTESIQSTAWVYVLVQNPGENEQIVGQKDDKNQIAFIPTFMDRDSAMQGALHIPKEKGKKFEVQAIIYEDLERYAAQSGFMLFIIDGDGRILHKKAPGMIQ